MSNIELFNFNNSELRFVEYDDTFEIAAIDLAKVFEYSDKKNLLDLVDDEYKSSYVFPTKTQGFDDSRGESTPPFKNIQELSTIKEAGLYQVLSKSNKPIAKVFQKWFYTEVLPMIRKKGYYINKQSTEDVYLNAIKELTTVVNKLSTEITDIKESSSKTINYLTESNKEKESVIKEYKKEQSKLDLIYSEFPGLERAIIYFKHHLDDPDQIYFTLKSYLDDKEMALSHGNKISVSRLVNGWLKVSGNTELVKSPNGLLFQTKHILLIDLAIKKTLNLIC